MRQAQSVKEFEQIEAREIGAPQALELQGHNLADEARARARSLLFDCVETFGLRASGRRGGYNQIWTRDSMITSLGILAAGEVGLYDAVLQSLITVKAHQTSRGLIPNKVDFDPKRVNFRAYADSGLWYVIVSCLYASRTRNRAFAYESYASLSRCLEWYRHQDGDQSGLISLQEGAEWKDLFCVRGKGLYVNVLFYMALNALADVADDIGAPENALELRDEAERLKKAINSRLWYEPGKALAEIIQDSFSTSSYDENGYDKLGRKILVPEKKILAEESYFLPYVTLRHYGEWFDTLGNLLAILSGLATDEQAEKILGFIEKYELAEPHPVRAVHPTQYPGDPDWRDYYKFGDLNLPEHYHNGGIWPMVGGFYVATLAERGRIEKARHALEKLAHANYLSNENGTWDFHEWIHGRDHIPGGMRDQAWNAGAYLLAHASLNTPDFKTTRMKKPTSEVASRITVRRPKIA